MTTTIVSMSVTRSDSAMRQAQSGNSGGNFRELNLQILPFPCKEKSKIPSNRVKISQNAPKPLEKFQKIHRETWGRSASMPKSRQNSKNQRIRCIFLRAKAEKVNCLTWNNPFWYKEKTGAPGAVRQLPHLAGEPRGAQFSIKTPDPLKYTPLNAAKSRRAPHETS